MCANLKTVQTMTTFRSLLVDPLGTRRGPPLVRGPQFENRWSGVLGAITEHRHAWSFGKWEQQK